MEEAKQFGATSFDALVHDDVREAYESESPAASGTPRGFVAYRRSRSPRSRSADPSGDGRLVESRPARLVGEERQEWRGRVGGDDGRQRVDQSC
jgi:hypothetical protein